MYNKTKACKVSVIIPVYNGEKYLRQCLDSVCGQTLRDIEIICVDDGSTDSSYDILEEYQAKDGRFKLFKQQNKFAGAARNFGKANASGEFLVFWDCDDFFELNALEKLYKHITKTKADICTCRANRFYERTQKVFPWAPYLNIKYTNGMDVFNRLSNEKYILNFTNAAVWNKMYRRSFIEDIDLDFQAIRNGNDVYFTVNALCLANRVTYIEDSLIYYRTNQGYSLVSTISKAAKTPIQAWMDSAENLVKRDAFPEQSFVNKCCDSLLYILRNIQNREAFYDAVKFLQEEGLEKLHIIKRDKSYYYNERYYDFVNHLCDDTPEDFRDYLMFFTYIQLTEETAYLNLYKTKTLSYKIKKMIKKTPVYSLYKKMHKK